jgi:hypothetical protein
VLYLAQPVPGAVTVVVVVAWIGVEAYAARGGTRQRDALQDGGTKRFLVLTLYAGLAAAIAIALYSHRASFHIVGETGLEPATPGPQTRLRLASEVGLERTRVLVAEEAVTERFLTQGMA